MVGKAAAGADSSPASLLENVPISPLRLCWKTFFDAAGLQTTAPLHLGLGRVSAAAVGVWKFLHF